MIDIIQQRGGRGVDVAHDDLESRGLLDAVEVNLDLYLGTAVPGLDSRTTPGATC